MTTVPEHPRGDVPATLNFYSPPPDGSVPYGLAGDIPPGVPLRNFSLDPQQILIQDARPNPSVFTLDHDAFQILLSQPPSSEKTFTDDSSIVKNYYPEVTSLLQSVLPGARKIIIFDRTSDPHLLPTVCMPF